MIDKDLIEFVERERPEVLPGRRLIYLENCGYYLDGVPEGLRSESEAAVLLVNWLIEELHNHQLSINVYGEQAYPETIYWHVSVGDPLADDYDCPKLYFTDKNLLSALWQAYKAIKEIK